MHVVRMERHGGEIGERANGGMSILIVIPSQIDIC